MATDDDKQVPEPDPWAGLDIGGAEDKGEEFTFSFDGLEDDAPNPADSLDAIPADPPATHSAEDPVVASIHDGLSELDEEAVGNPSGDHGHGDVAENDIPLAVFPPPEAEAAGSEVLIGTGRSGIIALSNAVDDSVEEGAIGQDAPENDFDDEDIAHELGLADVEGDAIAAESLAEGDDPDGGADFGETFAEVPSDDVSFDAGMMAGTLPFADGEQVGPVDDASSESWQDDPASIPLTAAVAAAGTAVAVAPAASRSGAAGKKGGGLGQMIGVVLGGLMALPITYAILIWGFQKDPFKLGKQMPEQLAFLLPQKLQPGYKPPRKAAAGPSLDAAPSLDDLPMADLPSADGAAPGPTPEPDTTADDEPTTPEPADSAEPAESKPMKTDAVVGTPAEPAAAAKTSEPGESPEPATEPDSKSGADTVAAPPAMADTKLAALPTTDVLPGLDSLMADAGVAVVATAPVAAPAALPPLDLTAVETAADRAVEAMEALEAVDDPLSPDRDRLLVSWYKRLAALGEELVRLETSAADSGRPLSPIPDPAADLLDRIRESDTSVADLDRLGSMWLTSQKRRADGVTLVVTLGASRQVGPYWSTRASVSGAEADGTDRSMAIISRSAPPADMGERVVVSGVMFDGDAVWAADMRPVTSQPQPDDDPQPDDEQQPDDERE